MAVPHWGNMNKIVMQDPDKKRLEMRLEQTKGYKPVMVKGKPMEIGEFNDFGGLYYAIVMEKIEQEKAP